MYVCVQVKSRSAGSPQSWNLQSWVLGATLRSLAIDPDQIPLQTHIYFILNYVYVFVSMCGHVLVGAGAYIGQRH